MQTNHTLSNYVFNYFLFKKNYNELFYKGNIHITSQYYLNFILLPRRPFTYTPLFYYSPFYTPPEERCSSIAMAAC